MWKLLLPLVLLMSGCAAQLRSSSERAVSVWSPGANTSKALAVAQDECAKYDGRKAQMVGQMRNNEFLFDCVR